MRPGEGIHPEGEQAAQFSAQAPSAPDQDVVGFHSEAFQDFARNLGAPPPAGMLRGITVQPFSRQGEARSGNDQNF